MAVFDAKPPKRRETLLLAIISCDRSLVARFLSLLLSFCPSLTSNQSVEGAKGGRLFPRDDRSVM